jgi:hypothetical protein
MRKGFNERPTASDGAAGTVSYNAGSAAVPFGNLRCIELVIVTTEMTELTFRTGDESKKAAT